MNPSDKITYRPRSREIPDPEVSEIPSNGKKKPTKEFLSGETQSRKDQDLFEELLLQQKATFEKTIADLEKTISDHEIKISEHKDTIKKATEKLRHINGLIT